MFQTLIRKKSDFRPYFSVTVLKHFVSFLLFQTLNLTVRNLLILCQLVVGHTDKGADRTHPLRLYRSLVSSKLDYGCIVYRSARQSDPIHHQGLRIALAAFRMSPAQSLYVEAHELWLASRRLKLVLNYVLKLKSLLENPAYGCLVVSENAKLFEDSPPKMLFLDNSMLPHLEKSNLNVGLIDNASCLDIDVWTLSAPTVQFDLAKFKKDTTNPET